jgi:hypothetical protein
MLKGYLYGVALIFFLSLFYEKLADPIPIFIVR